MHVSDITITEHPAYCQLQARVTSGRAADDAEGFAPFSLWYRLPLWCLPSLRVDNGDPFLAALLYPAMRAGERLTLPAPISPRLREALPELQAIYAAFDRYATPIAIAAGEQPLHPTPGPQATAGLFFSLGVDSFYSLLKNEEKRPADAHTITHLVSLHGIDTTHDGWDEAFPPDLLANFARVAAERGKTPLPVVTNVRQEVQRLAPWPMLHGGALASVALALGGLLGRVTIAASATYDKLYPWGTHPLLDPLWSTETLTVVHDGCELDTIAKTRLVARDPLVRETLRVCPWAGRGYNCGRCLKCLRTAIDLLQSGMLEHFPTLPRVIDPVRLRGELELGSGPVHLAAFRARLARFEAMGTHPELRDAIADYLATQEGAAAPPPRPRKSIVARLWRRWG